MCLIFYSVTKKMERYNLIVILFSAILISNTINAYVHNHQQQRGHHIVQHRQQNASNNGSDSDFFYNSNTNLIAFFSSSSQTGAIFNYTSTNYIIVNRKGAILISNSQVFTFNTSWTSQQSFEDYFKSIPSFNQSNQLANNASSAEIISDAANSLLGIRTQYGSQIFVEISRILNRLNSTINRIDRGGEGRLNFRGGIIRFLAVLKGISDLIPNFDNNNNNNASNFDLQEILNTTNGLEALLRILQSIGTQNDLSKILNSRFNDPEIFLRILSELGSGDSNNGINNIIRIIYALISISRNRESPDNLIRILLEIGRNGGIEFNGLDELNSTINQISKLFESQNSTYNNGQYFSAFLKFLRDLSSNNLTINDINISQIVILLRRGDFRGAIKAIVTFLVKLGNIFNPAQSIPRFFTQFLNLLNNGQISNNDINSLIGNNSGINAQLLQNSNISQILQNSHFGNISQAPIIGQIYNEFSSSLQTASNGTLNFENLLNFNRSVRVGDFLRASRPDNNNNNILQSGLSSFISGIYSGLGLFNEFASLIGNGAQSFSSIFNSFERPLFNPSNITETTTPLIENSTTHIVSEGSNKKTANLHHKKKHVLKHHHKDMKHHFHSRRHHEDHAILEHHH